MRLNGQSKRHSIIVYSVVALFSAAYFFILQWSQTFSDPDSFYHARITELISQQGLLYSFPWLQFTTLAQQFTDHHMLYHMMIVPFTIWLGPVAGIKVGQVVLLTMCSLILVWMLRQWKVPYSGWALLLLYTVWPFIIRMNLVKATALAMIIFLLLIVSTSKQRHVITLLLTIAYTWTHAGFILALVITTVLWIASSISASWRYQRVHFTDPRAIGAAFLGIIIGIVCSPYFPENLSFFWQQTVQIGIVNYSNVIQVGAEWYPFSANLLVSMVNVLAIACMGAIVIMIQQHKKYLGDPIALGLAALTVLFLIATLRSRRYVEYFVPMLWLWSCYVVLPYIASGQWKHHYERLRANFGKWFYILGTYVCVALLFGMGRSVYGAYDELHNKSTVITNYQAASDYLRINTPEQSVVFHASWDNFPILFFHNTHNYYIVGLDTTFMYLRDPELYNRWREIADGQVKSNVAQAIYESFNAKYTIIDRTAPHEQLLDAYLLRDTHAEVVYEDDTARIYHYLP